MFIALEDGLWQNVLRLIFVLEKKV